MDTRRWPRTVGRNAAIVSAGVLATGAVMAAGPSASADDRASTTYSGVASALGVRITMTVPNAPLTNTPIDSGGPTAQAVADSLGTSTGYAALPDPGQFVVSIPDLGNGLLSGGAGGLPPIALPPAPPYPFYVQSDGATRPEQSVGAGPYSLAASSSPARTTATAVGGFRSEASGNVALVRSDASITDLGDEVVSTATSDVQGLTVGPLSIAAIRSTATMSLLGGSVTPRSSVAITGVTIGSIPVAISGEDLNAFGQQTPLPLNSSLADVLKAAGISIQIVPAAAQQDRVYAPAVQITAPFKLEGQGDGTLTMTIGGGLAGLVGSGSTADVPASSATPGTSTGGASTPGAPTPGGADLATGPGALGVLPQTQVPSTAALDSAPVVMMPAAVGGAIGTFDVRLIYAVVVAGGMAAVGGAVHARAKG